MNSNFAKIKVGIIGASGYTGGELLRLLLTHPHVEIHCLFSRKNQGQEVGRIHPDLFYTQLKFTDELQSDCDLLFLCVPHGEAAKFIEENAIPEKVKIIDLSNEFRLNSSSNLGVRKFIYGLPELNREEIKQAHDIANPGCFATCISLSLLPLAASKLLTTVHITGITGSTGAGNSLTDSSHFSWRNNNIQAYKTLTHQHNAEVIQSLEKLQGNVDGFYFIPWRGDFTRGIFTSSQVESTLSLAENIELFKAYYKDHPFVHISTEPIHLKQVVNTNYCIINLEKQEDQLIIHAAIDNLIKGASGQAIQNMNLMFGYPEITGLQIKSNYF